MLISPGLAIFFPGEEAVGGPFLRLGFVAATVDPTDPDIEAERDSVMWLEVRGGHRFCTGKFALALQGRIAIGQEFCLRETGMPDWDYSRRADVGVLMTMGVAF